MEPQEVLVAVWWQGARVPEKGRQDIGSELPYREAASPAIPGSELTLPVQSKPWLLSGCHEEHMFGAQTSVSPVTLLSLPHSGLLLG